VSRDYIDFISAYCDSWCERCAFTERCSHFAVKVAESMCDGDFDEAIELAVGRAQEPGAAGQKKLRERMAEAFTDYEEPSEKELDEIGRELQQRDDRVRGHPLSESARDYSVAAHRWLDGFSGGDEIDGDALAIVRWDVYLIHVKIDRALRGRDEYPDGAWFESSSVQSDWNGSAKVALISIQRSERAWRSIAASLANDGATALADMLAGLRHATEREFPTAAEFRRPGFDDPPDGCAEKLRQ
jgi:hypothetical protein